MKKLKTIAFLCALSGLAACGKTYECPRQSLIPALVGYTADQADSVILRRFAAGSNFSQRIDSFLLNPGNTTFQRTSDTTVVFSRTLNVRVNDETYDYQLVNLFDGKTVLISELKFKIEEQHSGGLFGWDKRGDCFSPVLSYKENGVSVSATGKGNEYLFLRK